MKLSRSKILGIAAFIAALLALLALLLSWPVSQFLEHSDAAFRMADQAIQRDFEDLKACRQHGGLSATEFASAVSTLRARELELFDAVRRHYFKNLTESNYWHRGRLKFPGSIEMELQTLRESDPAAMPP